jgi:hypothetical protein
MMDTSRRGKTCRECITAGGIDDARCYFCPHKNTNIVGNLLRNTRKFCEKWRKNGKNRSK